jgi:hypothetical protein
MNVLMSPKVQFKMQLEDDRVERLKIVAKRFGRDTAQEVAEEILSTYFPVWLAVAEATGRAVDFQTRRILESGEQSKREVNSSKIAAHIGPAEPTAEMTRDEVQRMIDASQSESQRRPKTTKTEQQRFRNDVEPNSGERVALRPPFGRVNGRDRKR